MAYTKSQLEAIKNTLLASNQPILANQHREQIQSMIDEMYDAQSRADILVGVQADTITGGSDTFIVFRNGEAYQIPLSLLSANTLANLGDVFISNLQDGETLVYNAVANRWENQNIFLGFALSNLEDVQLTSLANGDILRYNSSSEKWENTSLATILSPYALLTDLNAYQLLSEKGQANGYAQLDTGAKLPISIIPDSVLGQVEYEGTWNAATNTPTLPTTPIKKGEYYVVSTAGTFVGIDFQVGDWIISNGTIWEKVDNTDAVTSVFGRLGNIVANASDYSAFYVTLDTGQNITAPKTFSGSITVEQGVRLVTEGTALETVLKNINSESITTSGSNGFGFNNANNIYFAGSAKGGGILAWNNTANRTYTLPDASGTIALTSDLGSFVTLNTVQTITAQKTFSNSGSASNIIVNHTSGSGIALDITKAGNGEGLRVAKSSGSGNAVTITGGLLSAGAATFTGALNGNTTATFNGDIQTNSRFLSFNGGEFIVLQPNSGGTINEITASGGLPLHITTGGTLGLAAGSLTPQFTLVSTGAATFTGTMRIGTINNGVGDFITTDANGVLTKRTAAETLSDIGAAPSVAGGYLPLSGGTLTGALNGTSASFSGNVIINGSSLDINPSSGNPNITLRSGNTFRGYIEGDSNGGLSFGAGASASIYLTLASTGAATFSSSVTANGLYANTGNSARFYRGANDFYWSINNDSNNFLNFGTFAANGTAYGSNPKMILQDNGNVGIGTTSVSGTYEKLAVAGGISIKDNTSAKLEIGRFNTTGAQNSYIKLGANSESLRITNNIDTIDLVTFQNNGNVGIGTDTPGAPLEIQSDSGGTAIRIKARSAGNAGTLRFFDNASSTQLAKIESSENSFEIGSLNNVFAAFLTNATERLRITSAGRIQIQLAGIPTSDPNIAGQLYRNAIGQLFISLGVV